MAYFCLSHNHNDFHDIASYVISKTLSYTDAVLNKSDVSSPYKKWAVHIDAKSQTDFNALSNKSTWLSGRNDLMKRIQVMLLLGFFGVRTATSLTVCTVIFIGMGVLTILKRLIRLPMIILWLFLILK